MEEIFVHETAEVEEQVTIGQGTRIWNHVQVRSNAKIGEGCNLGKNVYIDADVTVGDRVKMQNNVFVCRGVTVEEDVFLGPSVVFTNDMYPRAFSSDWQITKTLVQKGASIGANATIRCGITVGEYAMIGAGSVVTKDVLPFALVLGNPAKQVGWVCKCGMKRNEQGVCTMCGEHHALGRTTKVE